MYANEKLVKARGSGVMLVRRLALDAATEMPSPPTKPVTQRSRWNLGGRQAWTQFAVICVLAALIAVLSRPSRQPAKWLPVQGTIQETRITPDKAVETNWGGQLTWKAEYRVAYSVAGREYTVWGDSGIRRESEAAVRLALPQSRPSCWIRYNTKRPEESVADCR